DDVLTVAAHDLGITTGRARDLPALADLDLDVVHDRADRHVSDRHGIARLHVGVLARNDGVSLRKSLRRQYVGELAVLVLDECDEPSAVGIVFDPLDLGRHIQLAAFEVDLAVGLLVTATAKAHRDAPTVVAPTACIPAFSQCLHRCAAMQARAIDQHELALARGYRIVGLECHRAASSQTRCHVDLMAFFEGDDRALDQRLLTHGPLESLNLAFAQMRIDALYFDVEQLLDRLLDLRLGRIPGNLEHHLVPLRSERSLLGNHRRDDHVIVARIGGAHLNRASNASSADFVSTSICRRRMSYTLMPCTGSTSMSGMLRAARAKFASSCAPSIMSALVSPSLAKFFRSVPVFASFTLALSRTMMPPSLALADKACLRASARTFFGRPVAWLRGVDQNERPPPRKTLTLAGPGVGRAEPVPLCRYIFLPVRLISLRFLTSCVPRWRLASCQRTQRCKMSALGSRPKIASGSSTEPAALPSSETILSSMSGPL